MSDRNKSNRLLCSVSGTQPAILKVFDMNVKDISFDQDCVCDNHKLKKNLQIKTAFSTKNHTINDDRPIFEVSTTRQENIRSGKKSEAFQQSSCWEDSCTGMDKSLSMAGLSRGKQTMPSSRVVKAEQEYPFRPTLSKRSQQLAKIRSNLNLSIFQDLYCRKPKCNHNHQSRQKPQHCKNSSSKPCKTHRNSMKQGDFSKPPSMKSTTLSRVDRGLSASQEEADLNLMNFLNRKLFGVEP